MCYYFRAMRRAVFSDLKWLFGLEIENTATVHPKRMTLEEEAHIYFKQLRESWE
jgi:hypothetical protein